jgi:hypothetical protein
MKQLTEIMKQLTPMKSLKLRLNALLFATATAVLITDLGGAEKPSDPDIALKPAHVIVNPWLRHIPPTKRQGVPGIERTAKGRLWAVYGRDVESTRNYQVLIRSDDDGKSWSDAQLMILPRRGVRAMSATNWIDPQGRLWVFWGQAFGVQDGRYGIFAIVSDDPDADELQWSAPRRLGDGIMLNKPTVLSNGDWLLTSSVWKTDNSIKVYASTNQGESFSLRGTANIADPKTRGPDEPMIVERKDGSLWMLVRMQGLAETISTDRGKTWAPVQRSSIKHCTARFFVRRLKSGSLLLVKHGPLDQRVGREQLTAYVSDDDGKTWSGGLMIDERADVTYPDGVQAEDGRIYIIYDHQRTPLGEVLMATFTEEDVRAGEPVSDKIRLRGRVARLPIEKADAQVKP